MKSTYRTSFLIIFVIMLSLLFGGNYWLKINEIEANKKELKKLIENPEHFISIDDLADRIINDDPSLFLIDIRSAEEFDKYHIPGAINVELKETLNYLTDEAENLSSFDVVLIGNDSFYAEFIYVLSDTDSEILVLNGGMQSWYNTIINPQKPNNNSDVIALNEYASRKGASMYFGVKYPEEIIKKAPVKKVEVPKKVVPVKKKKKLPIEGGC